MNKIQIGDRVKMSEKALANFSGKSREFASRHVYEVVGKDASIIQGVRLKLHCGTTLMEDEAEIVPRGTPLHV